MGLSSSSSTSGPSAQALPYLTKASSAVTDAYNANQGNLGEISSGLSSAFSQFQDKTQHNPMLDAARGYVTDNLGHGYSENPQLGNVINNTNGDITDRINAIFNRAGQSGSSRQIGELGKQLSANESNLRYQDVNNWQAQQNQQVQNALALNQGDNQNAQTLAGLGSAAASTPYLGAQFLAQGLGGLWGNSTTTKQEQSPWAALLNAGAQAGSAAIMASDSRLKTDIERTGALPDGLGVYQFRYIAPPTEAIGRHMPKGGDPVHIGVMADEVAQLRPWALGPTIDGYMTVDYSKLEAA